MTARDNRAPRRRTSSAGLGPAGSAAQLDIVVSFFGIILVFLSLLTFAVQREQDEPVPTRYLPIEPKTRAVHSPRLAYSVPFYRFLLLDAHGLFELDMQPIAEALLASDLSAEDFGISLQDPQGRVYGTLALEPTDVSGFWLQLDAVALHSSGLLQPLLTPPAGETAPAAAWLLDAVAQLEQPARPGHALIHVAADQAPAAADALVAALVARGWKVKARPMDEGKIVLQRHPDYFVLTDYFR